MARLRPARRARDARHRLARDLSPRCAPARTTPNGGVYIAMGHLGPDNVRQQFKGMVERCADCGFDLAGGLVEVVPTAHYMMGGVRVRRRLHDRRCRASSSRARTPAACTAPTASAATASRTRRCSAASPATRMAALDRRRERRLARARRRRARSRPRSRAPTRPFAQARRATSSALREALYDLMWDDVGIMRDAAGLRARRARARRARGRARRRPASPTATARFNLTWHDWLNLAEPDRRRAASIAHAALAREDSRGAHFREDFPETGDLETSTCTSSSRQGGRPTDDQPPAGPVHAGAAGADDSRGRGRDLAAGLRAAGLGPPGAPSEEPMARSADASAAAADTVRRQLDAMARIAVWCASVSILHPAHNVAAGRGCSASQPLSGSSRMAKDFDTHGGQQSLLQSDHPRRLRSVATNGAEAVARRRRQRAVRFARRRLRHTWRAGRAWGSRRSRWRAPTRWWFPRATSRR